MKEKIILPNGVVLPWLEKTPEMFFHKAIIMYGSTNTGKTKLILDIMYQLRNHISGVFLICKTEKSAESYASYIPRCVIKYSLPRNWMVKLIKKQEERTRIYELVQNIKILEPIFDKLEIHEATVMKTQIINLANARISNINLDSNMSKSNKIANIKKINSIRDTTLKNLYRDYIRSNAENRLTNKTEIEDIVIKFLDINPNILLIFDDCAAEIKKWTRQDAALKELFYQGRHVSLTSIFAVQSDKELDSELKKNARINFFTTYDDAIMYFSRSSMGSKRLQEINELCCKQIFQDPDIEPTSNFQKLVYLRDSLDMPFRITVADEYEEGQFQIGSKSLWEADSLLSEDNDTKIKEIHKKYINSGKNEFEY